MLRAHRAISFGSSAIALLACAAIAPAQTARDSTIAKTQRATSDSVAKMVVPALAEVCDNRKPSAKQKIACPSYGRFFARFVSTESALVATVIVPPPPLPPPPPTPVIVPPAPTPVDTSSLAEPVYDATKSTMLFQQDFESYADSTLRPVDSTRATPCNPLPSARIIDHSWTYSTACGQSGGVDYGVKIGAGHSGKGVQWHYDGVYQETHGVVLTAGVPPTGKAASVVQYWAQFTPDIPGALTTTDANGNGSAMFQIKNIMLWHDTNRFQIMTHTHFGCPLYGPSYTMLGVIDQVDVDCNSDQPIGPYLKDYANGQWHRWTILYKPNTAQGSRDGIARLWIDGTLVIRIETGACVANQTDPAAKIAGGWKGWCSLAELDGLYSGAFGVNVLEWGANRTDQTGLAFTMAIDDVKWWKLN